MSNLNQIKREIKIFKITIAKFVKKVKHSMGVSKIKKTSQDRMILKLVKSLLENKDMHVFFSPISSKVYVHSPEKEIVVIYDLYKISITNHKFFFTSYLMEGVGEEIIKIAKERIETEMSHIDVEAKSNEMNFLNDVYKNFSNSQSQKEVVLSSGFLNADKYLEELALK